jgi:hypothetical protein
MKIGGASAPLVDPTNDLSGRCQLNRIVALYKVQANDGGTMRLKVEINYLRERTRQLAVLPDVRQDGAVSHRFVL